MYEANGIGVDVASTKRMTLPGLEDVEMGECRVGMVTQEQRQLFTSRGGASATDVSVYFVRGALCGGGGAHRVAVGAGA